MEFGVVLPHIGAFAREHVVERIQAVAHVLRERRERTALGDNWGNLVLDGKPLGAKATARMERSPSAGRIAARPSLGFPRRSDPCEV